MQHEDGCPCFDGDTGGEASAREGYGHGLFGAVADGLAHLLQRIVAFVVGVAVTVASYVDNLKLTEDGVVAQFDAHTPCCCHAGQRPQRMTEIAAPLLPTERITLRASKKGEEVVDVVVMAEMLVVAAAVHAEELGEVECMVPVLIVFQLHAEVVGIDVQARETCIGVGVAVMGLVPLLLGALFHHIVPGEDVGLVVVVEQVEWSAREFEFFSVATKEGCDDSLP